MSSLLLRRFGETDTSLKSFEVIDYVTHGTDLISDEAFVVKTKKQMDGSIGDLAYFKYKNIDYFYYVDKIINEFEFTVKNILEIFNQDVYLPKNETNITLYQFIDKFFVNNTVDLLMNINYLDISLIDDNILNNKISLDINSNKDEIYNAKNVMIDTILGSRMTFEILNDLNNGKIKIKIQPQNVFQEINLDNPCFWNVEIPRIEKDKNCVDIIEIESSNQIEISRTISRFYLLNDNTVSSNAGALNRVLPPRQGVKILSYETGEIVDAESIARDALINTNDFNWSFTLNDSNKMYSSESFKIGDLIDVYKSGVLFRSVLTGIIRCENETEFRFGTNRLDIISIINNNK